MAKVFIAFDEADRYVADILKGQLEKLRFDVHPLDARQNLDPPPQLGGDDATIVIWSKDALANPGVSMAAGAAAQRGKAVHAYTVATGDGYPPGAVPVADVERIKARLAEVGVKPAPPPPAEPDWTFFYLLLGGAGIIAGLIMMISIAAPPEPHYADCETFYTYDGRVLERCADSY